MWRHFVRISCKLHVNHTRVGSDIIYVILWTRKFNIKFKRLDWIKGHKIYHFIKRYKYIKSFCTFVHLPLPPLLRVCDDAEEAVGGGAQHQPRGLRGWGIGDDAGNHTDINIWNHWITDNYFDRFLHLLIIIQHKVILFDYLYGDKLVGFTIMSQPIMLILVNWFEFWVNKVSFNIDLLNPTCLGLT